MRCFPDKNGRLINFYSIEGCDSLSGMLEGSPRMVRRWRLHRAQEKIQKGESVYFWKLDELEKEIKSELYEDEWPPRERWIAKFKQSTCLGQFNDCFRYENEYLEIHWFQDETDPFETLKEIMSKIDFTSLCKTEISDEHD